MDRYSVLLMAAAAVVLLYLFLQIIRLPLKWLLKALLHAAIGFVALFIFNFLGSWIGVELELNIFNALVTGVFGVPGVLILLVVKYIL